MSYCSINTNGTFGICNTTGGGFSRPTSVAINTAKNIAYVTNASTNNISYCSINPDGSFGTCNVGGSGLSTPFGMTINSDNSLVYIANFTDTTVSVCSINNDGSIGSCSYTGSGFNSPLNVTLTASGTKAYIKNNVTGGGQPLYTSVCDVNPSGTFGTCLTTIGPGEGGTIAINSAGTLAYITAAVGAVLFCGFNPDGTFAESTCNIAGNGFSFPWGIVVL